jgi:hypothetical protein
MELPPGLPFQKEWENFRFKNGQEPAGDKPEDFMIANTEILESQKP